MKLLLASFVFFIVNGETPMCFPDLTLKYSSISTYKTSCIFQRYILKLLKTDDRETEVLNSFLFLLTPYEASF